MSDQASCGRGERAAQLERFEAKIRCGCRNIAQGFEPGVALEMEGLPQYSPQRWVGLSNHNDFGENVSTETGACAIL